MPMQRNLIEYSNNYLKTSGSLCQYSKYIRAVDDDGDVEHFYTTDATDSFNFKAKLTGQTDDDGKINSVEIMVSLKYLSNFWRTLEITLINCEVNPILTWFAN